MKSASVWMIGLILFGGMVYGLLPHEIVRIEAQVRHQVEAQLKGPETSGIKARVSGQTVTLYAEPSLDPQTKRTQLLAAQSKLKALGAHTGTALDHIPDASFLVASQHVHLNALKSPVTSVALSDEAPPVSVTRQSQTAEAMVTDLYNEVIASSVSNKNDHSVVSSSDQTIQGPRMEQASTLADSGSLASDTFAPQPTPVAKAVDSKTLERIMACNQKVSASLAAHPIAAKVTQEAFNAANAELIEALRSQMTECQDQAKLNIVAFIPAKGVVLSEGYDINSYGSAVALAEALKDHGLANDRIHIETRDLKTYDRSQLGRPQLDSGAHRALVSLNISAQ